MTGRWLGLAAALSGAAMAVLAFLPWYAADASGARLTEVGVSATGELWALPLLGVLALAAGVALAVRGERPGSPGARLLGGLVLAAGAVGAFWAVKNAIDVPVRLVADPAGDPIALAHRVDLEPAALGCAAAACVAAVAGLVAMRPELRR
jgi:hypothetical protein